MDITVNMANRRNGPQRKLMGKEYTINCIKGESVLEALRRQGIAINSLCGGRGSCGKCRVLLDETGMNEPSYDELTLMSEDDNSLGVRLACYTIAQKDVDKVTVTIVDDPDDGAPILTDTDELFARNDTTVRKHGTFAAIDLGTTTLAAKFVKDGKAVFTTSRRNSQCSYGADVMSRNEVSINGWSSELKTCIENDINALFAEFPEQPQRLIMAGNTTMIHLLMGYPVDGLVKYPFKPHYSGWHKFAYPTPDGAVPCTILPNLSAYIGGDVISGLYYCDFAWDNRVNLFVDLGTNGEMAIGNRDMILTASAAAGPAFEGTPINVATDVIKCMADLRRNGIIDENGLLKDPYFDTGYHYETEGSYTTITQEDIRNIQMAKSAIRAGISVLMDRYGVNSHNIGHLYLAGGMGHGLDIESAVTIGLIPGDLADKVVPVGNSSLAGCIKYGNLSRDDGDIDDILGVSEEILLSNEDDFSALYYENMMF